LAGVTGRLLHKPVISGQLSAPVRSGDGATGSGGPDPRDLESTPRSHDGNFRRDADGAEPDNVVRVKTRDFR
jgi:hypothetical protein